MIGRARALILAASAVLAGVVPATAAGQAASFSPPTPLSAHAYGGEPHESSFNVAHTFGGGVHLAVWRDGRGGVFASRLSPDGEILDLPAITVRPIASHPFTEHAPALAWSGSSFLVVWAERAGEGNATDVYASRVSAQGELLDPEAIPIATSPSFEMSPTVAWNGTTFLVAWTVIEDGGINCGPGRCVPFSHSPGVVQAARVGPDGTLLDDPPVTVGPGVGRVAVTGAGDGFAVLWGYGAIEGALVDVLGAVSGPRTVVASPGPDAWAVDPQIVPAADGFALAWTELRMRVIVCRTATGRESTHHQVGDILFAPLDAGLGPLEEPFVVAGGSESETAPSLVRRGAAFMLAWGYSNPSNAVPCIDDQAGTVTTVNGFVRASLAVAPLNDAGRPGPVSLLSGGALPVLSGDGPAALLTWSAIRGERGRVLASRVSAAGEIVDPAGVLIAQGARHQGTPAVAWDGQGYLAVWSEDRGGGSDIYAGRLDADGAFLDGQGFPVTDAPGEQTRPAIAWNGGAFVVAWEDRASASPSIRSRLVVDGAPSGEEVTLSSGIPGGHRSPRLAVNDDGTALIAWEHAPNAPECFAEFEPGWRCDLLGVRVGGGGEVLDPVPLVIATGPGTRLAPDVASDGDDFLVVYETIVTADSTRACVGFWPLPSVCTPLLGANTRGIMGTRVSGSGAVEAASLVALAPPIAPAGTYLPRYQHPAVAWGDGEYLVAWIYDLEFDRSVLAVRTDRAGAPSGRWFRAHEETGARADRPAVAYAEGRFLLAWTSGWGASSASILEADGTAVAVAPVGSGLMLDDGLSLVAARDRWTLAWVEYRREHPYAGSRRAFVSFLDAS